MNHIIFPSRRCGKPSAGLLLLAALWLGSCFIPGFSQAFADKHGYWHQIADHINSQVTQAVEHYRQGDTVAARSAVVRAYFAEFEDTRMEAAMRREIGAKQTWELEQMFGRLRKAIKQRQDVSLVAAVADEIRTAVDSGAIMLDQTGISPEVFEVNQ
jgi:hypothetical protein